MLKSMAGKGWLSPSKQALAKAIPPSSILFLLATEPLNLSIAQNNRNLMYNTEGGINVGQILFADDNLNTLRLSTAEEVRPLLQLYSEFQQVSGLNINIRKSQALCINTSPAVIAGLRELGIETPEHIKHLGLYLGKNIQDTVTVTVRQIDPKALKRIIFTTTPPTDLLN
jgi:hypothetical protein